MPSPLERLTSALADRYRIERELGAGGMATVYLAHDLRHERDVAVKVLHPDLGAVLGAERFLTEIKTTAKLQHPHILPLLDSGEADGLVFYVMPLVEGETLRSRLERERQLPLDDALRIATETASALDYAHRHGVIHRDIKPENILLHDGRAVVADFGIALAVSAASGPRMTQTGLSLGTPQYMAPEQAMGERQIDARADVYALGAVTYEMLTGEPPFGGATVQAIVAKVLTEKPMLLTSVRDTVPRHVEATVLKALAKLPADRFASCAAFAEHLTRPELTGAGIAATHAGAAAPARVVRRFVSASPAVWALLAVSLIAAAWGWSRRPEAKVNPVTKVYFEPGSDVSLVAVPQITISNDGLRFAFAGYDSAFRSAGGVRRIYVRSLDRVDPVPVPGTQNATGAFFSPDGESIGFFQDGKLRTVPLRGGAVTTVCDWALPSGATWGDDGSIVFSSRQLLYRVPATGGTPQQVMKSARRGGIIRPHFLPGARELLAQAVEDSVGIVAIRLRDTTVTRVLPTGSFPAYADGGLLVYGNDDGSLFAAPFDLAKLRVTGPAEPVTDQVLRGGGGIARFGLARNGTLALLVGDAATVREVVLTDRTGRASALPIGPRRYRFPRFSPNGLQLAFHAEVRGTVLGDLWRYTLDGGTLLRLTSDSVSGQPEWSPDGKSLVYMRRSPDPGSTALELWRISADGIDAPRRVLKRPNSIYESRITPDSRTIVFREDADGNNRDILMAPLDTPTAARPLAASAFDEKGLAMSPDGKWLAYSSNEAGGNEIYIRRIQDVSSRWPVTRDGGTEPRWAKNGELFFRRGDSIFVSRVELGAEPRVGPPRALFAGSYASTGFEPLWDVSPDGSRFVFVRNPPGATGTSIGLLMNWVEQWRARHR